METINRVVDEANRAIWGNNPDTSNTLASEEPVAGKQGKGTANEPYDLGNAEGMFSPRSNGPPTAATGIYAGPSIPRRRLKNTSD